MKSDFLNLAKVFLIVFHLALGEARFNAMSATKQSLGRSKASVELYRQNYVRVLQSAVFIWHCSNFQNAFDSTDVKLNLPVLVKGLETTYPANHDR